MSDEPIELERIECEAENLDHYKRMRTLLHRSRHPAFMGPDQMSRCIKKGGHVWIYTHNGEDVATLWTEPAKGYPDEQHGFVISVVGEWKSKGLAREILQRDGPRFGRAIDGVLGFFADCGYRICGPAKTDKKRHVVYPLSRDPRDWLDPETEDGMLAEETLRVSLDAYRAEREERAAKAHAKAPRELAPELSTMRFSELIGHTPSAKREAQLRLLDAMLQQALRDGDLANALKIQSEAARLLRTM